MNVGAAIRINSANETRIIEHATTFAQRHGVVCYVISIVPDMRFGDDDAVIVRSNLNLISERGAIPIMQEGNDIPSALIAVARAFGITTLVLRNGTARRLGKTIAEQLLVLDPPFDVVVIGTE